MRILFLTNMYLEVGWGGEDVSCRQVVEGLEERGHATLVLTSMHGTHNVPSVANGVHRSLYLEMDLVPWRNSLTFFTQRKAREAHNLKCLDQALDQFTPDIVFIWGMWNLPRSLPALAEARYPHRVLYRFASYWPTLPSQYELYWRAPGRTWYSRPAKRVLGSIAMAMLASEKRRAPLAFRHAICVSAAARDRLVAAGIPIPQARIIHTGLDAQRYPPPQQHQPRSYESPNLNLLYAGRLVPEKGVETAIASLERLVWAHGLRSIRLSLAGSGAADYESHFRQLVSHARLNEYVSFLGHVPADRMPQLLQQFDVVVVPSIWPEPFSRMTLEGMASGLVVVATPTGGTPEILKHGENGLLFTPGDADDLAQQIIDLHANPELRRRLAIAGQQTVTERFTSTRMLNEIECYLKEIAFPQAQQRTERQEGLEGSFSPSLPTLSVIIPTYNRREFLRNALRALAQQTYPSERFEVIVVDDGSTDGTEAIAAERFPFALRYYRQSNQGDAAARNLGARHSHAELLVFIDDDMLLDPNYLTGLVHAQERRRSRIVAGVWNPWLPESTPLVEALRVSEIPGQSAATTELSFTQVQSNNMALGREAFFEIGMMQSLAFSGSSMWCDLDFSYRAYQKGFEFCRSRQAVCWHQDHHIRTLEAYSQRRRTAAYRAVVLFQKYPELMAHTPMFHDKTPVTWGKDPPRLIARKLARSIASTRPALWCMEQIIRALEKRRPASGILTSLYRYVIGGYIFRGYREGLGAFGQVKT